MTDISAAMITVQTTFSEVAKQASGLALGLQNAAPSDKNNMPNKSVQYLFEIAETLHEFGQQCKKIPTTEDHQQIEQLHALTQETLQQDKVLRDKYQMGDKFRFIRDRLAALVKEMDALVDSIKVTKAKKEMVVGEDEALVYVYLFNAQGINLSTWFRMVNRSVFYEYSVNRPIYLDKASIQAFINKKSNKVQHGFLTIMVKKQDILTTDENGTLKDSDDHAIVKVKEGSLDFNKLISFTHNGQEYIVGEDGSLKKKG